MRLVFLGSGAFGLPTLHALAERHEVVLVVSQPDRPAGRSRTMTATPVAQWALDTGVPLERPEDVNTAESVETIRGIAPDALVVIAFGQSAAAARGGSRSICTPAARLPGRRRSIAMIDGCTRTGSR